MMTEQAELLVAGKRRCFRCKRVKAINEFMLNAARPGGRGYSCKACRPKQERTPTRREYERAHARRREKTPKFYADQAAAVARYKASNAKKARVREQVRGAIERGDLDRGPCEVCGAHEVEGHHDDYDAPLEVRWLCKLHHDDWHRVYGEGKNPQ